ncbi:hypothetical protein RMCBS344292_05946 [Rhizopus microsporus]|nr:hypothetical protein RMCBS344292_05946 [Rhizopus microsporus]
MDWKSIKNLLRMDEARLLQIEQNGISFSFPPSLRINYCDARNVINARLMKLNRRAVRDRDSVQIWIEELAEKGAKTLFKVHEDGPFLVSWVAKWQIKHLQEAEKWSIDSTHKTCRSFNDPKKRRLLVHCCY